MRQVEIGRPNKRMVADLADSSAHAGVLDRKSGNLIENLAENLGERDIAVGNGAGADHRPARSGDGSGHRTRSFDKVLGKVLDTVGKRVGIPSARPQTRRPGARTRWLLPTREYARGRARR